jgi:hypothetical protein
VTGDVEVHFHASDWRAHGHADDRAYDRVALHVVLFPPAAGERPARRHDGGEIPTLVLLPLLHRDLEEYASDDALEGITARDEWERFAELAATPPAELPALLRGLAAERWRQKLHFAQLRGAKLGWTAAAHQTALEILGYRQNRAAMLAVAARFPLAEWVKGIDDRAIFSTEGIRWQLQGVRPANHPRVRLRQYRTWVAAVPDWPEKLTTALEAVVRVQREGQETGASGTGAVEPARATRSWRQAMRMAELRADLARTLTGGAVGGSRLDNLVCDGFLPLLAARTGCDLWPVWFHWYLGDVPGPLREVLPKLGVAGRGAPPHCHGWAQGLLGWILSREVRASR